MVLGKRHGSLIKRTTSMRMITLDTATINDQASQPPDHLTTHQHHHNPTVVMATQNDDFLRTCSFCNRNLCHRRDIYMYRGDNAFCSLKCREKQIKLDERKVKNGVQISKKSIRF
ncbi:hypothetical protein EUTSA_v10005159mg [Eutrema salsugineum]|uniref:FLZ-type domain-containing protein n=1 Tax=Eutrema salsugineum TaxID=72664 RepID=V4KJH3_EUTSA|nr:uncharacterized protein LOC18011928 [Eutrema salsugineum]ESQ31369.1 hypothetical protein EUTSA_v10005159mg [Eutrema salsugineum]